MSETQDVPTTSTASQRLQQHCSHSHSHSQLYEIDAKLKRWRSAVATKFKHLSASKARETHPQALLSVFGTPGHVHHAVWIDPAHYGSAVKGPAAPPQSRREEEIKEMRQKKMDEEQLEFEREIAAAKEAISHGIQPKMISKGTSGSYFVRARIVDTSTNNNVTEQAPGIETVAVFKPKDEEPYGNLNPKRKFLRKYLWWAMGRPCLIPNFSYLSEVGASYLNDRMGIDMVPPTTLVELSSPAFSYDYETRRLFRADAHAHPLPTKIGSYQRFLHGFVNMSDFLRQHPWPPDAGGRPQSVQERDFKEEAKAHKKARRRSKARLRRCAAGCLDTLLCKRDLDYSEVQGRQQSGGEDTNGDVYPSHRLSMVNGIHHQSSDIGAEFHWTTELMESFRLELEKLVVLDYLMRNTDRGLDNAMVSVWSTKPDLASGAPAPGSGGSGSQDSIVRRMKIGAIDSSLSFPHSHPSGMREYPFGWLWLPSSLIGQPFSAGIRAQLLPVLNDPLWWRETVAGLRIIFEKDRFFDEAIFERQMALLKGQGWNIVQSLRNPEEGPLELCARLKKVVKTDRRDLPLSELFDPANADGVSIVLLDSSIQFPFVGPSDEIIQATGKHAVGAGPATPLPASASIVRAATAPDGPLPSTAATARSIPQPLPGLRDPMAKILREAGSRRRAMSPHSKGSNAGVGSGHAEALGGIAPRVVDEGEGVQEQLGIEVVAELENAARKAGFPKYMRQARSRISRDAANSSTGAISIESVLAQAVAEERGDQEGETDVPGSPELEEQAMNLSVASLPSTMGLVAPPLSRRAQTARARGSTVGTAATPRWGPFIGSGVAGATSGEQAEPKVLTLVERLLTDRSRALLKWY
ncbi:hypothetical protein K437DRAFT_258600 [Tilletiaria anomala UBC 951]|uniref:Phosphatidylinositol 4-kinase n=1 Tax=Tilletiaria anomala (strain ATCC 24038 / CBS 436.72 / UBC 951) TaxID=1037660 RepID=A0A066VPU3_TILAU|nr:uncharacterized protein K437DRAFT_258600 [Tilletiaria anomala UBC 951]KDN40610.1 hypothetical protein K437DRAFT_258600 [Tilletiaria anomala UBC 951]